LERNEKEPAVIRRLVPLVAILPVLLAAPAANALGPSIGAGLHYLRTVGDINDTSGFDENSLGILGAVTFSFPVVRAEGILEWIPDSGTGDSMIQPQAWGMLGTLFYGGLGIGIGYADGDWQDKPFYGLRAGVNFGLLGKSADGFVQYRFQSTDDLPGGTKDLDALTLGAILRFM
jgi:hypothetical protein